MEKRYKDILRPLVAELRRTLAGTADGSTRGDLDRELERLGIVPDGTIAPADVMANPTEAERRARAVAAAELGAITDVKERIAARTAFVERAAYGWINRLMALRVLEARGLIDETLRGNPDYEGLSEALYILRQSDPARASGPDGGWWAVIEDACAAQAAALPGLFALGTPPGASSAALSVALHDPAIALRPSTTALLRCVELLGASLATPATRRLKPPGKGISAVESSSPSYPAVLTAGPSAGSADLDAAFADPDAIGWAYQFYQEEAKAQVYARLKGGKKVGTRDEIAAATQLFTEPYMVKWLLQNSLGRSYHEAYPRSALPETWEYYIRPEQLDAPTGIDHSLRSGLAAAPAFTALESLTLLDPCMGSGHFLREAFDMLVAMYREQQPALDAAAIADRTLARHLHGIDIDPRAAQLAAFTLYARAWELVRDERRARRQPGPGSYAPAALNLATTPDGIAPGALARHLQRHPGDRPLEPLLKGVFAALENADILGSLLRPREHLAAAIAELRRPRQLQIQPDPDLQTVQEAIENILRTDPSQLEDMLLERVAASFAAEAGGADDVAAALFGRAAERGVRLLQLLDRQYAVVVTNPPYLGTRNMSSVIKYWLETHFAAGKRDLYAAFILRCLQLCSVGGRIGMITQLGWMFLQSFADLRNSSDETASNNGYRGLLQSASVETLAHLGAHSFEEIGGEIVQSAMFCVANKEAPCGHRIIALRLTGVKNTEQKAELLKTERSRRFLIEQQRLVALPGSPLIYWVSPTFLNLLGNQTNDQDWIDVRTGIVTGNNERFIRAFWERSPESRSWTIYLKGGGFRKWRGYEHWSLNWPGSRSLIMQNPVGRVKDPSFFGKTGWNYTLLCAGNLSTRFLHETWVYDNSSPVVFPVSTDIYALGAVLQSKLTSYLLRLLSQSIRFNAFYFRHLPKPKNIPSTVSKLARSCVDIKTVMVSEDPSEMCFSYSTLRSEATTIGQTSCSNLTLASLLVICEGYIENQVHEIYDLGPNDIYHLFEETGIHPCYYPIVEHYDRLPELHESIALQEFVVPDCVANHLHSWQRRSPSDEELCVLKHRLELLYGEGPGSKIVADADSTGEAILSEDEDLSISGGRIETPSETFLEELSIKLQIHPISVYWLLQEIRAEGARCKPEEQRLLEDRLSVIVLRLLGHRWPKQIEAGEPVPEWADGDGIIPLLAGSGEAPLPERVRERLRAEDGDLGAQQAEALLSELTGQNLETWLRRDFFPRQVRQFKYRPIAWHLSSTPQPAGASGTRGRGRGGARQIPVFECLVYAHAAGAGLLARIRTQYVEPLLHAERGRESAARQAGDDTTAAQANARARELVAFTERLRGVEEQGFACAELDVILAKEPLDRWSGDGILPPSSHDAMLAQEQAWMVDVNDGVRVNIAPVQLAGVLATAVLKEPDARKAIADRARWRADERRWVREGVLPRCGWMAEDVPASPRWTERAPEREAERARLEAKRAAALRKLETSNAR